MKGLLFDIGNTRIKWAVLDSGELAKTGAIGHTTLREKGIDALTRRLPRDANDALACNVAGSDVGSRLARVIGLHIGGDLRFAHSTRQGYGLVNAYTRPRSLGVDRWVAMIGGRAEFSGALCVVDAGTAVTIDAVDRDGYHLGGQILPGLVPMASALETRTSDIGATRRTSAAESADAEFAATTRGAVTAGAINALCGAVDRAVKTLRRQGHRPKLILTGGDASRILSGLGGAAEHRPHLVLQGLAHMMQSES